MAGVSWLVDKKTIATRIKNASTETAEVRFESNPHISCPNCQHVIDNTNLKQQLPGLPKGVKFDPSDQDIMSHLLAKVGAGDSEPHPFIDEFITTIEEDGGICYTHPQYLPGVSQDGNVAHFFHKAIKAFNIGGRKRRRVFDQDIGDLRWRKTGRTRPIFLDGVQQGCKKIMVLYTMPSDGGKSEKTNWVMHQYHIGLEDTEREGEYVISKIFYQQQQQVNLGKKDDQDVPETSEASNARVVDPVTPNFVTPEIPCNKKQCSEINQEQESLQEPQHISQILPNITHQWLHDNQEYGCGERSHMNQEQESHHMNQAQEQEPHHMNQEPNHFSQISPNLQRLLDSDQNDFGELPNIDLSQNNERIDDIDLSLYLCNSQQFAEESTLMFNFLQNQSPKRNVEDREQMEQQPSLFGYAHVGAEHSQKAIQECQNGYAHLGAEQYAHLGVEQSQKATQECQNGYAHLGAQKATQECHNEYAHLGAEQYAHLGVEQSQKATQECQNGYAHLGAQKAIQECQNGYAHLGAEQYAHLGVEQSQKATQECQNGYAHLGAQKAIQECQNGYAHLGAEQYAHLGVEQSQKATQECQNGYAHLGAQKATQECHNEYAHLGAEQYAHLGVEQSQKATQECQNGYAHLGAQKATQECHNEYAHLGAEQYAHLGVEQSQKATQECQNGYAHLEAEQWQKATLECQNPNFEQYAQNPNFDTTMNNVGECQNPDLDAGNVELDPLSSDFHLSQLDFSSQDSYIAWGGSISKTFK